MIDQDDLLPEGLEDRLPSEAKAVSRAMRGVLDVMHAHGFDRVSPPLVEFEKALAGRMDGVSPRRMFRFVDPISLRTLALRSDITPQIGRIAATGMAHAARPLRLCYGGEVALIRADQLDPARQRLQLGAELIGSDTVAAAAEMVSLAVEALEQAGATGISVDFTLPDLVDILAPTAMPLQPAHVAKVRRELDTKDAGGLAEIPGGDAYLPLIYATGPFDEAIERLSAVDAGGALSSRIAGLRQIAERVGCTARITLDPTERHGFEYQSWFGFTLYADGVRGALGRGGTYSIGGTDEAATGFSLYIDALVDALAPEGKPDSLFLPLDHDRAVASRLRAIGWRTVAALSDSDDGTALGCTHRLDGAEPVRM
ncbi:ATP phosphoribosyltransferase regulatory subunit [Altererythrobacter confluentis]|uniref:ATP phosphoribosyltransferase regulatory subunit n=1 Tax=Allopontixanthobacter confluentis TaxID=1849021 RepID=A0A6L7GDE1_9SPHN|nr:ATP phosphoribosyltransferase regulatory subunit [Allopontixanthobacter confluentis]MXP13515.1 ATP phosphoribosyltransferase regulatory subunit [Allopontixanthobacter confluentis]